MGRSSVRSRSMSRAWDRGSLLAHPHRRAITRIQGWERLRLRCRVVVRPFSALPDGGSACTRCDLRFRDP